MEFVIVLVSISLELMSLVFVKLLFTFELLMLLSSAVEFAIVLFVARPPAAVAVFRSLAFTLPPVTFEYRTAELSMFERLMALPVALELSMLVFCICPRVIVDCVIVLLVIVVFSARVWLMSLSRMSLVFIVVFCMLLPMMRESVAVLLSSVVWFTNESSVLLFETVQLSIALF